MLILIVVALIIGLVIYGVLRSKKTLSPTTTSGGSFNPTSKIGELIDSDLEEIGGGSSFGISSSFESKFATLVTQTVVFIILSIIYSTGIFISAVFYTLIVYYEVFLLVKLLFSHDARQGWADGWKDHSLSAFGVPTVSYWKRVIIDWAKFLFEVNQEVSQG